MERVPEGVLKVLEKIFEITDGFYLAVGTSLVLRFDFERLLSDLMGIFNIGNFEIDERTLHVVLTAWG